MKTLQEICTPKAIKVSVIVVGILLIASASFAGGVSVGLHKARFSYAFGENYERNFIQGRDWDRDADRGVRGGMMMRGFGMMDDRGFRNGYGVSGEILSLSDAGIVIKDRDGKENTIAISDTTVIKSGHSTVRASDLKAGERVVIIGKPSDTGTINADFIRVFEPVVVYQ